MYFGSESQDPLKVDNEMEFQSAWVTIKGADNGNEVNVYLNGSTDPAFSGTMTLGDGHDSSFANYLTVGLRTRRCSPD